jgi:transcriptional regulator with XRE-family HTH domain
MNRRSVELNHPNIGINIRKIRELRNYTQLYMAQKLNISKSRYSQLELEQNINTKYLFQIAEILDTTVPVIIEFDEKRVFDKIKTTKHISELTEPAKYQADDNLASLVNVLRKLLEQPFNKDYLPMIFGFVLIG